jgi:ABC-type dipeptide/oligopeptide/nickel transport system permease subunit
MALATATTTPLISADAPGRMSRARRAAGQAVIVIAALAVIVLLAWPGIIAHVGPTVTGDDILRGPSAAHWFGTDQLGRDVFSRTIYGARPVLIASLLGVVLATVAGVGIGLAAGTAPRWLNSVIMRIVDVLLAIPVLMIALILIATAGSGVRSIVIAIGVAFTPGFARIVEASVRKLRSAEYVQAARVFGSSPARTSVRHLLPNLLTEVVVLGTSAIGWAVLTATTLSFLGLGVQLPQPDWGTDLAAGATNLATSWWLSVFPGLAITVTILAANFIGDYLLTAADPGGGLRRAHDLRAMLLGRRKPAARPAAGIPAAGGATAGGATADGATAGGAQAEPPAGGPQAGGTA